MSSVESLREFMNERFTAAAEEILRVFQNRIVEYEQEIARQRKMLDIVWKPHVKLHKIEHPQGNVCGKEKEGEEDDRDEQHLSLQERNCSLEQVSAEIKEEEEQLCIRQEGQQPLLKQEELMLNCSEETDPLLLIQDSDVTENQDPVEDQHGDPGSSPGSNQESTECDKNMSCSNTVYKPNVTDSHCDTHTGEKPFTCDTCGKSFKGKAHFQRHLKVHTAEKPYSCKTCGEHFRVKRTLHEHMRIHTGEKPYSCKECGKDFRFSSDITIHMRIHTGKKPYSCKVCKKDFRFKGNLNTHMRTHTGEKPYSCKTCGKSFSQISTLTLHKTVHTGEKPHSCSTCGKTFTRSSLLKKHSMIHSGEKLST